LSNEDLINQIYKLDKYKYIFLLCVLQHLVALINETFVNIILETEHKSEYIKFLTKYSNDIKKPIIKFPENTIIKQHIMNFKRILFIILNSISRETKENQLLNHT